MFEEHVRNTFCYTERYRFYHVLGIRFVLWTLFKLILLFRVLRDCHFCRLFEKIKVVSVFKSNLIFWENFFLIFLIVSRFLELAKFSELAVHSLFLPRTFLDVKAWRICQEHFEAHWTIQVSRRPGYSHSFLNSGRIGVLSEYLSYQPHSALKNLFCRVFDRFSIPEIENLFFKGKIIFFRKYWNTSEIAKKLPEIG